MHSDTLNALDMCKCCSKLTKSSAHSLFIYKQIKQTKLISETVHMKLMTSTEANVCKCNQSIDTTYQQVQHHALVVTCLRECKQPSICTQYHTSYCFKQLDKSIKIWYWLIDYSSSFVTIISVSSAVSRPTTTTCPPVNLDGLLVSTVLSNQQHHVSISWLTEQLLTSPPTQYRLSGRRKLTGQKTQPTVSKYWRKSRYKSKENPGKKQTTQNTAIQ